MTPLYKAFNTITILIVSHITIITINKVKYTEKCHEVAWKVKRSSRITGFV